MNGDRVTVSGLAAMLQALIDEGHGDVELWATNITANGARHARYNPQLAKVCLPKHSGAYPKWAEDLQYQRRPENWDIPFTVVRL